MAQSGCTIAVSQSRLRTGPSQILMLLGGLGYRWCCRLGMVLKYSPSLFCTTLLSPELFLEARAPARAIWVLRERRVPCR
jgi:hypothetical protein